MSVSQLPFIPLYLIAISSLPGCVLIRTLTTHINWCVLQLSNSGPSFQKLENAILAINHVSVLLGYFNVNLLDNTNTVTTNLSSSMLGFGFTQLIQEPTRVSKSSIAIIDHVYVSPIASDTATTSFPPLGSSDHNCILVALPLKVKLKPTMHSRNIWLYKHAV